MYSTAAALGSHLATHPAFTAAVCGVCATFFSSPQYLAQHLAAAHGHTPPNPNPAPTAPVGLTVHTPKGLEVQKLPADQQVTTASPDSSIDQDAASATPNAGVTTAAAASSATPTEGVKRGGMEGDGGDSMSASSPSRCGSVDTASLASTGSRTSSPRPPSTPGGGEGTGDPDLRFYKHKKYSMHRKRIGSNAGSVTGGESGGEGAPPDKVPRVEGVTSPRPRRPPPPPPPRPRRPRSPGRAQSSRRSRPARTKPPTRSRPRPRSRPPRTRARARTARAGGPSGRRGARWPPKRQVNPVFSITYRFSFCD